MKEEKSVGSFKNCTFAFSLHSPCYISFLYPKRRQLVPRLLRTVKGWYAAAAADLRCLWCTCPTCKTSDKSCLLMQIRQNIVPFVFLRNNCQFRFAISRTVGASKFHVLIDFCFGRCVPLKIIGFRSTPCDKWLGIQEMWVVVTERSGEVDCKFESCSDF